MRNAPQSDHSSLGEMIVDLRKGRFAIPDFQRQFVWEPSDIQELLRSIFRDYYIGNLLLWKAIPRRFDEFSCKPITGYPDDHGDLQYIVLDGQQRLSAIYYAFMAPDIPAPKRSSRYLYFIDIERFQKEDFEAAFPYEWTKRGINLLNDRQDQYRNHRFPVSILGETPGILSNWLQGYKDFWVEQESGSETNEDLSVAQTAVQNAEDFAEHIWGIRDSYKISYIALDQNLEPDKVCDIFTKINKTGVRLDIFDLLNALLRPKEIRLSHLWDDAKDRLEFIKTERKNVYVLQVMSLIKQGLCSPQYLYYLVPGADRPNHGIQVSDKLDFIRQWDAAIAAITAAVNRLSESREFGAISSKFLPYQSIIPAFSAIHVASRQGDPNSWPSTSRKLRQWYWASVFAQRYSGSVESTAAIDYREVCAWFEDDTTEPSAIRDFRTAIQGLDLRDQARQGTAVYNGIINLLVRSGATDWLKDESPGGEDTDDHHIVPKSWGEEVGIGNKINTVLNRTLLSAETNRKIIGSNLPNKYLPVLLTQNDESKVREIFKSHFISDEAFAILQKDPFTIDDFDRFISVRESTILDAIRDILDVDTEQDALELEN